MVYQYLAVKEGGDMVRGRLSATSEEVALNLLDYAGYRVITLKVFAPLFSIDQLKSRFSKAKTAEVILFYRQLALLLESGMDIISALEIIKEQADKYIWKKVLREVIADLRSGQPLSKALDRHPKVFSPMCRQSLRVGEQTGGIETILRQVADYMQKEANAVKGIKSALTYPIIALVAAIAVIVVLVGFVLPAFGNLYSSLGAQMPTITRVIIDFSVAFQKHLLQLGLAVAALIGGVFVYLRTPHGRFFKDKFILRVPLMGRISHLKELARCCRSISLLFRAGLSLTEVMPLVISSLSNRSIVRALNRVQEDMLKGEGLSKPMRRNPLFLPMMVQMVKVGEETGNLDTTLLAVAESYETEAKDKTDALIAMIQPTMTVVIGGMVGLIALSMISAMYSIYGQAF